MGESTDGIILKHLQTLYSVGAIGGLSDGQLWDHVLAGRDDAAEAAFTILAERHGPMVLRICRQMLGDRHEAEDAFQATFLVLASKAHSIRNRDSVASWLHGVARRVASRARADAARRRIHERRAAIRAVEGSPDQGGPYESWPELHAEIARLPERYREPIVLCYLEGLTTEAVSQRLGCPQGTVLSRLSRARERLRKSLTRRGLTLPAGLLATELCSDVAMAVPTALLYTTVRAALSFVARQAAGGTVASATAVGLARGVIYAMTLSQWKTIGAATLACVLAMGSLRAFAQFGGIGVGEKAPAAEPTADDRPAALSRSVAKIQAELDEANRRNAELQTQLQSIQAKLKALRVAPSVAKEARSTGRRPSGLIAPAAENSEVDQGQPRAAQNRNQTSSLKVTPIIGPGVSAVMLQGPKITRIAATSSTGRWITQDLREPVKAAVPIVDPGIAIYNLGRYIYAFSPRAEQWGVLELPKDYEKGSVRGNLASAVIEANGHIYTFDTEAAKWNDFNLGAILETPDDKELEDAEPRSPRP